MNNLISNLTQQFSCVRLPILTNFQITYKCNFKCLYCYQKPLRKVNTMELNFQAISNIIKCIKLQGGLGIRLTGGEILTRKDFIEIYNLCSKYKFKIILDTNISLLNDEILATLEKYKPYNIYITLYGTSNSTYEKFTGYKNGWDMVKQNIKKLISKNINVSLKTVLHKINLSDCEDMYRFAQDHNLDIRTYYNILSDCSNYKCDDIVLSIDEKKKILYLNKSYLKDKEKQIEKWKNGIPYCSVGKTICNVDPFGNMYFCDIKKNIKKYNIQEKGFEVCWKIMHSERKKYLEKITECSYCNNNGYCGLCSPMLEEEYRTKKLLQKRCDEMADLRKWY